MPYDRARVEEAARRWSDALAAWAIPEHIRSTAPTPPWGFSPEPFAAAARVVLEQAPDTPSFRRAVEAIGGGGTVLDVGAGAGAASLPLAPPASHLVAVDESAEMLAVFARLARERGLSHSELQGRWPEVAHRTEPADMVVCHHVVYNVDDISRFVQELDRHARRRVVVELTESHPLSDLNMAWREIHGIERPERPVADDLVGLLDAMGVPVQVERFSRTWSPSRAIGAERVALARRRLCVGPERDEEIARLLPAGDRALVTLWWDIAPPRSDRGRR